MSGAARAWASAVFAVGGAALVAWGFFLPWLDGTGEFSAREFSGFDLARLVRNFEIVASSSREEGQFRATAAVLYLVPALGVNAGVFAVVPALRRWAAAALLAGAVYGGFVLVAAGVLATVSWTELEGVMGEAMLGYWVSLAGVVLLGVAGISGYRARA